jgi:hypothetical protein
LPLPKKPAGPIKGTYTIHSTEEKTEDKLSVLYRGPEKSGKTHAMASFPKPLVFFCDRNLSTLRKFRGVDYIILEDYGEYHRNWLPALRMGTRPELADYETIGVDSLTTLFRMCRSYAEDLGYKGFDLWGYILKTFIDDLDVLLSLSKATRGSKPTYHIVCTIHEEDVLNAENRLEKVALAVQGKSQGQIAPLFDSVFCTSAVTKKTGSPPTLETEYVIHTKPPDRYHPCGDGIGGGGGKYNELPSRMDGTYPSLIKAWGMEEEEEEEKEENE